MTCCKNKETVCVWGGLLWGKMEERKFGRNQTSQAVKIEEK